MQVSFQYPKVSGDVPLERCKHAMASIGKLIYVYGGESGTKQFGDLYVIDGMITVMETIDLVESNTVESEKQNWKVIETNNPSPRWGCSMISFDKKLYLFGGENREGLLSDLYCYNPEGGEWELCVQEGITPTGRSMHSVCVAKGKMYLFGGVSEDDLGNDIYALNLRTLEWSLLESDSNDEPEPMRRSTMVHHEGKLFLWGGWLISSLQYSGLWVFDVAKREWERPTTRGPEPEKRGGHVCEVREDKMFIFGGWAGGNAYFNSVHYLDLDDLRWAKLRGSGKVPAERCDCDSTRIGKKFIVFGGKLPEEKEYTNEFLMIDVGNIY